MTFPSVVPRLSAEAVFGNLAGLAQFLTSTFAMDVVAIYDQQTLQQVFPYARPMEANQIKAIKVMDYPIENGSVISDHRIILPVYVDMSLLVPVGDYQATYQQIQQIALNDTLLKIQTKNDVMSNFIIEQYPDRQSAENFDKSIMRLRLKQVQIITSPTKYAASAPSQQPTVKRGQIAAKPAASVPIQPNPDFIPGNRMQPAQNERYIQGTNPSGGRFGGIINNSKPLNVSGK